MLVEIRREANYLYCEKCNFKMEIHHLEFGSDKGLVCPKCNHGNIMLDDPDFFLKLFKGVPEKKYSKRYLVHIDKDRFFEDLESFLNETDVYKYDIYDVSNNDEIPEYNYMAVFLIEL